MPKRKRKLRKSISRFIVLSILVMSLFLGYRVLSKQIGFFHPRVANVRHGWNLILIKSDSRIPDDYQVELIDLSNGQSVDARIYPYLQQMFDDMRAQHIYPTVTSGYRSWEFQQTLMNDKIAYYQNRGYSYSEAEQEARKWVFEPGCSEHQIGIAVDINADTKTNLSESDEVHGWLADNAWKYGFILRYPMNKIDITHISFEPWHYRYVGIEAAQIMVESNLCLEEYLDTLH